MAIWPSGLRRWNQALPYPVRKGVGSNPTVVNFLLFIRTGSYMALRLHANYANCLVLNFVGSHHLYSCVAAAMQPVFSAMPLAVFP